LRRTYRCVLAPYICSKTNAVWLLTNQAQLAERQV